MEHRAISQKKLIQRTIEVISSKLKTPDDLTIGVEIETMLVDGALRRIPVNRRPPLAEQDSREGRVSSVELKDRLMELNQKSHISPKLSVEPGGQIEYGSDHYSDLLQLRHQWQIVFQNLIQLCEEENLLVLDFAIDPIYSAEEVELINLKKYRLMDGLFSKTGGHGRWMMKNTASLQVNLDYESLEEASQMAFVADCLQPFFSMIFSNCPFTKGKKAGKKNCRLLIWQDTDPSRCGGLLFHGIDRIEGLIEKFGEIALSAPAIFGLDETGEYFPFKGTLEQWLTRLSEEGKLTTFYILNSLHQIFTHVRFKDILEVRTCDRPPLDYELAPAALIAGLFRSPKIQDHLLEVVLRWTPEERKQAIEKSTALDLYQTAFEGRTFLWWIEKLFVMALDGLNDRHRIAGMPDETVLLMPFTEEFLRHGPFSIRVQKEFQKSGKTVKDFIKDRWLDYREKLSEIYSLRKCDFGVR